jgi:hypothetical protein
MILCRIKLNPSRSAYFPELSKKGMVRFRFVEEAKPPLAASWSKVRLERR